MDPNSITDWFKRHGMDCSGYQARENPRGLGWTNYRRTIDQNTAMLNYLKSRYGI